MVSNSTPGKVAPPASQYGSSFATPVSALFPLLIQQMQLIRDRLQSLPSTYDKMVVGVTQLQRHVLELYGLLRYMKIYQRRMNNPDSAPTLVDKCVGAFTSDPNVAQQFRAAGLPYWLLRPTCTFTVENILEAVVPVDPATELQLDPAPDSRAIKTGTSTCDKTTAIQQTWMSTSWYHDPFNAQQSLSGEGTTVVTSPAAAAPAPIAGPSNRVQEVNIVGQRGGGCK